MYDTSEQRCPRRATIFFQMGGGGEGNGTAGGALQNFVMMIQWLQI